MSSSSQTQPTFGRMLIRWLVPAVYLLSVLGASTHVALHHGTPHDTVTESGQLALSVPDCGDHHADAKSACTVCATLLRTVALPADAVADSALLIAVHMPASTQEAPPTHTRALPGQRGPPRQV